MPVTDCSRSCPGLTPAHLHVFEWSCFLWAGFCTYRWELESQGSIIPAEVHVYLRRQDISRYNIAHMYTRFMGVYQEPRPVFNVFVTHDLWGFVDEIPNCLCFE